MELSDSLYVKIISKKLRDLYDPKTEEEFTKYYDSLTLNDKNQLEDDQEQDNSIPMTKEEVFK